MNFNIIEIFENVVELANDALSLSGTDAIKFEVGSLREINEIVERENRGDGGFPLLWLYSNYAEKPSTNFAYDFSTDLQLFYIEQTKQPDEKTKSKEKLKDQLSSMNDTVEVLLTLLSYSKYVNNQEGVYSFELEKTKISYFGQADGNKNKFNSKCEAIELNISNLQIKYKC